MRIRRRTYRRAATLTATAAVLLGVPGSAAAGGIDPTRHCIQDAANTYLYNPYSLSLALEFVNDLRSCGRGFTGHMLDEEQRRDYVECLDYGLDRTIFTQAPEPLLYAAHECTVTWLQVHAQIDPIP